MISTYVIKCNHVGDNSKENKWTKSVSPIMNKDASLCRGGYVCNTTFAYFLGLKSSTHLKYARKWVRLFSQTFLKCACHYIRCMICKLNKPKSPFRLHAIMYNQFLCVFIPHKNVFVCFDNFYCWKETDSTDERST